MKDTNLSFIETVNDERKNLCNIEHTRHRSVSNFAINLVTGLIAYNFTKEIIFEHRHHRQKQTYCIISLYRTPTLTNIRAKNTRCLPRKTSRHLVIFSTRSREKALKDKIFFYTKNRMKVPVNRLFLTIFAVIPPTYSKATIIL